MPYYLDGNNLIGHARKQSRPGEEDRALLVAELCDRLRRTRATAVLFFDGPAPVGARTLGSLAIRSSGARSADALILGEIARAPSPGEIVLVTADRDLSRRARDAGARTVAPEAFWAQFGKTPPDRPEDRTPVDVEEWLRYFGDDGNRER